MNLFLTMAAEREVPPHQEVPELGHRPLRAPALPDLDINQTALADNLAKRPLAMQRLTIWLKVKSDPMQSSRSSSESCPSWFTTVPTP